MKRSLFNVVILGLSFFLVFTSFQTAGMIQNAVIDGINDEFSKQWNLKWSGYYSFCIIYAVLSIANWIAPSVVAAIGPRVSMILGALTYCIFVANFLYPMRYGLYIASVIIGLGAGIIWTGQGNFLTLNSTAETMTRNSGIFWAMLQCSLLFGNLFVFYQFQGKTKIEASTRMITYSVFLAVGVLGSLFLFILRDRCRSEAADDIIGPLTALSLELAFFSVVYGTAIGRSLTLAKDPSKYIGISGMIIGAGEIIGGAFFGLLGSKTVKNGRDPIILFGFLVHISAFLITFLNLPPNSSLYETDSPTYISSSIPLALCCSFLLGLGDSCFNTQIYSILGSVYAKESASAFAIFKFVQSIAAAIAFLYANSLNLHAQIFILSVTGAFGTLTFCLVEWIVFYEAVISVHSSSSSEPMN
ncbi:UNC93-like protein MFSD11 [Dinothrombium tinctorium]|uniref:UNC93-like protein MFSD11 n=1 Tax=Dinothrombium tinctorium TaxID=1965070 RepID=A0A3S4R321_9ACAR|nr:UNC93-like protein MFSD11 [Dinothrombium tinctorium]RWS10933.1 UNC93-like protein MFSD11 [Dinothrombium tinctorium]RWS10973.1 UNC93-like protein MFSD11 [Dinothrombium tinctorium]